MKTVTLELPDHVDEDDVRLLAMLSLVDHGIISSGKAAELLGMRLADFLELAAQRGSNIYAASFASDLAALSPRKP